MPTGYTAGVVDGTVTSFQEYALTCARAFGALVTLRDEPLGSTIPEFTASDYDLKAVASAKAKLERFSAMTEKELFDCYKNEFIAAVKKHYEREDEKREVRKRLEAMLEKAKSFEAPTEDHAEYAKFIIKQLEETIAHDCATYPFSYCGFEEWKRIQFEDTKRDISYHTGQHEEELRRTNSRNEWVKKLREAIEKVVE